MKVLSSMEMKTLKLYLYMGSSDKVIEMCKECGVTTREEAVSFLSPYMSSIVRSAFTYAGRGSSLAGAANGSERILAAFPSEKSEVK